MNPGASVLRGALAGAVATLAMSAHMLGRPSVERIGTPPPQRIATALLRDRSSGERAVAAIAIHFAIGVGSGALFGLLRRRRLSGPVAGMLFGLGVWAVGYELVVPALGALPAAHRDRHDRRAALIQAHLVYGGTLGVLT